MKIAKTIFSLAGGTLLAMGALLSTTPALAATISFGSGCTQGAAYTGISFAQNGDVTLTCGAAPAGPGTIGVTPASTTVNTGATISLTPTRTGGTSGALDATFTALGACTSGGGSISFPTGSATPTTSNPITFPASSTAGTCTIHLTGVGTAAVSADTLITVVDPAAPGKVAFAANQAATAGQLSPVTISITRPGAGSLAPAATVDYACVVTTSPSGTYSPTYTAPTGATTSNAGVSFTVNWAAGTATQPGNATQYITATVPAFTSPTTGAKITCTLTNPTPATGGPTLGNAIHEVTILQPSSVPANCMIKDKTATWPS